MRRLLTQVGLALLFLMTFSSIGLAQAGTITTIAGNGEYGFNGNSGFATSIILANPRGISVDALGNVFFSDSQNFRIRKVTPEGIITTVAGKGSSGFSGDGGLATLAELYSPDSTAIDSLGDIYIVEKSIHRIRKVDESGIISTVVGNGYEGFSGDGGPATLAQLSNPQGVAVDAAGNLFIVDSGNNRIRKVDALGIISTVAGNGSIGWDGDGGPATLAQLSNPQGVTVDTAGNLFIADYGNNRIRKVDAAGIISTLAGDGSLGFSGDNGPATLAQLSNPQSVWADAAGNLFISDYGNNRIRKVDPAGLIHTIAGTGGYGFSGDGGPATSAQLYSPLDISMDSEGNLYFADVGNNRVRKIQGPGAVTVYFPQVALGGGYSTFFTIANTGSTESSATLILADSDGHPLTAMGEVDNPSSGTRNLTDSSFPILLPPGGVSFMSATSLNPNDPMQVGWARLVSAGGLLTSTAAYEFRVRGTLQTMVGVLQSQRIQYATIPVDNSASRKKQLAYAIVNPSGQAITVKMALVAQDGTVVDDTRTISLSPGKHIAKYLWEDLGNMDFKGSLVLQGENGVTFVVIALLDKEGILTAIPVVPGKAPVVAN